jgi:hypothetical protein
MEITKLNTVEDITGAIRALEDMRRARPAGRTAKPAQMREEAARFADLYEMRADLWRALGTRAFALKSIADAYGSACAVAEKHDRDAVRYWRNQAGAR